MEKRTFAEIAQEIRQTWSKVNFAAEPYLEALSTLNTTDPSELYFFEEARTIVLYFLSNASTWRGDDARRIKAELKSMIK